MNRLDIWDSRTLSLSGTDAVRQVQRMLVMQLSDKPVDRPDSIDGFFGEDTARAAEAFSKLYGVDLPPGLPSSGVNEAVERILAWKKADNTRQDAPVSVDDEQNRSPRVNIFELGVPFERGAIRVVGEIRTRCASNVTGTVVDRGNREFESGIVFVYACDRAEVDAGDRLSAQLDTYELDLKGGMLEYLASSYVSCEYLRRHFPPIRPKACN